MKWTTLAIGLAALALPALAQTDADEARRRKLRDAKLDAKRQQIAQQAKRAVPRLEFALKLLAQQGIDATEFEARFQQHRIDTLLASRITIDFPPEIQLREACEFFRIATRVNVVLGPGCDPQAGLTLPVSKGTLRQGFDSVCKATGLSWSLVGPVVYLHPPGAKPPQVPEVDANWLNVYGAKQVELNFSPPVLVEHGVDYLEAFLKAKFVVDPQVAQRHVELLLRKEPLPLVLTLLADQAGATWTVEGGKVVIRARK